MTEETANAGKSGYRDEKGRFKEGNPGGKLKEGSISLTAVIERKLKELHPDGKREAIEMLADNIIQDALDSNNKMRTLIWNYVDGMPKQSVEISEIDGLKTNKDIFEDED